MLHQKSLDAAPTTLDEVFQLIKDFKPDESAEKSSLKVVGYRIKPLPIHRCVHFNTTISSFCVVVYCCYINRIEVLGLDDIQLLIMRTKIQNAAELLGEVLRVQGRAKHMVRA
jgi:hypothetical protein